nr:PilC/PilY family type IV pilus protein [Aromatoleum diolicum]
MIRRITTLLVLGAALTGSFTPSAMAAATDIADIPMAVRNNVPPNFMLMLDNSGSMSNIVPDSPFEADPKNVPSYLGGACTDRNKLILTDNAVSLRIVSGAPKVELASPVGSGGTATSCTNGCAVGTASGEVCFDDNATYTRVRLLTTGSCGSNCTTASGASYLPAAYTGRYLNWYFRNGSQTGWTDRKPGTQTRLEMAKAGAKAALDTVPLKSATTATKARFGLATYNGTTGGVLAQGVADLDATQLGTLKTRIDALSATGSTPIAETLADIGHYFTRGYTGNLTIHPGATGQATVSVANLFRQGSTSPHTLSGASGSCTGSACPVQYWCQRSYAILMTDGRPQEDQDLSTNAYLCDYDGDSGTCTTNGAKAFDQKTGAAASSHNGHKGGPHSYESAGSDYLDDVAQALFEIDLRPDLTAPSGSTKPGNNVRTYTVGFADEQAKNDPLMQEAAAQGGGLFLTADNADTLKKAFVSAIGSAQAKDAAAAAVAVTSSVLAENNTSYASSYNPGYWTGDLEAFSLDKATGLPIKSGQTDDALWSAQAKLDALISPQTSRKIVSYNGSNGSAFTAGNYRNDSIGLTDKVIDYLRGDRTHEGGTTAPIFRVRQSLLGDIINAESVIVTYSGTTVVYQPANDGMVHAFDGTTGSTGGNELWAYVPALLHSSLAQLADPAYVHRYYVDATPAVADLTISGVRKKILVGGLGKGGRGYYALDITDPAAASESAVASKVMWEALGSQANMGFSFGTPLIVSTPNDGWVVLVTSGYNNGTTTGGDGKGRVWALDPRDGRILREISTGVGTPSSPSGLAHLARLSGASATQTTRYVYGGDLLGNVWRFDLATWSAVNIAELEDGAGAPQPVSSAPVVRQVSGTTDKFFVYVGTGQYLGVSDVPGEAGANAHATQTQSMYGIIDDASIASPTLPNIRGSNGSACPDGGGNGDFVCQKTASSTSTSFALTAHPLQSTHRGWYFDIPVANSRINTHPAITTAGVLIFTANVPTNALCDPGGSSWFIAVDGDTGGSVKKSTKGSETYESGWSLGSALASRPVIVETSSGKRALIRMSDKGVKNPAIPETAPPTPSAVKWRRIYWRELM